MLVVTIDRPDNKLNAVDDTLHHELGELFTLLKNEREARCIVLTGAAGGAFSAGGDFAWFPTLQAPGRLEELRHEAKKLIWDLLDVQIPIVAAINGHAMGLGTSIALLCDIIFVAESAKIGDPHVAVGIVAGDGGTIAWPLAVGPALAKQYLLTGDPISAAEAHRIGLVNFVTNDDECFDDALVFARRIAAGAPLAIQHTKLAVNAMIKANAGQAFDYATALEMTTFRTDDHREALAALAEKRTPRFTGQ